MCYFCATPSTVSLRPIHDRKVSGSTLAVDAATYPPCVILFRTNNTDTVRQCQQFLPHAGTQWTAYGSVFSAVCDFFIHSFFVCESNISGTAERISAKFTVKTCWFPRADEVERYRHDTDTLSSCLESPHTFLFIHHNGRNSTHGMSDRDTWVLARVVR